MKTIVNIKLGIIFYGYKNTITHARHYCMLSACRKSLIGRKVRPVLSLSLPIVDLLRLKAPIKEFVVVHIKNPDVALSANAKYGDTNKTLGENLIDMNVDIILQSTYLCAFTPLVKSMLSNVCVVDVLASMP